MALKDYTTGATNKILIGTGGIGLIITAIVGLSGRTPAYQTRDSSGQNTWNVSIDGTSVQSGSITTKNLINCNTIDTTSTGMLVCGSDATGAGSGFGTGNVVTIGDSKYVNVGGDTMTGALNVRAALSGSSLFTLSGYRTCTMKTTATGAVYCGSDIDTNTDLFNTGSILSKTEGKYVNVGGDTMTGSLTINVTGGSQQSIGLKVLNTVSGASIHAESILTSSGILVVEGAARINSGATVNGRITFVGYSSTPQLTAADPDTGIHFDGPGIISFHNGGTQTMLLSSTNKVGIGIGSPKTKLEVVGAISGATLYTSSGLSTSGSLTVKGTTSGSAIRGFGLLTDCDTAGTSKLLWDTTLGRFSCGTDTDTTYTAGQGLTLNGTSFRLNAAITGSSLNVTGTVSGALAVFSNYHTCTLKTSSTGNIICGTDLTSTSTFGTGNVVSIGDSKYVNIGGDTMTGTLVINPAAGYALNARGTISGALITQNGAGNNYFLGNVGIGIASPSSPLHVVGDIRFGDNGAYQNLVMGTDTALAGYNQTNFIKPTTIPGSGDAATALYLQNAVGAGKNRIDLIVDGKLGIGTTSPNAKLSVSGAVVIGNNIGSATAKAQFDVKGTISGSTLYAATSLQSSGSLVWEGAASGATLWVSKFDGAGLVDCDLTTNKVLWDITLDRFSCGTDLNTGSVSTGALLGAADRKYVNLGGDTITGALTINLTTGFTGLNIKQTTSGSIIHAERGLTSSGALTFESSASGGILYISRNSTFSSDQITFSSSGSTVFNAGSQGVDFRINGTTAGLFYLDASANRIGINKTDPRTTLDVNGTLSGQIIHAEKNLSSSGTIVAERTISGALIRGTTFSGSVLRVNEQSIRKRGWELFSTGTTITTGSGKQLLAIADPTMTGYVLKFAYLAVQTAGTTNTTSVQVRNVTRGNCKLFSTVISIDSAEKASDTAATPYVVNSSCASIGGYDLLEADVPAVSTTAPKASMQLFLWYFKT